ncbi:uncharacterized protein LOC134077857 isoform X2 [Sardina pilchardus]|uniref:uncharacterized protein LOC134077857 isoform X2 n=1 Tax=Sardina pilchardus TaxID=27697 RepID=UPI002E0F6940
MANRLPLQYLSLCGILLYLTRGDEVISISKHLKENVTLHCNTSGRMVTRIRWLKDGNERFTYSSVVNRTITSFTSKRISVDPTTMMLHISDVQVSDEGIYMCEVSSNSGPMRTRTWNITILQLQPTPGPSQLHHPMIYISTAAISGTIIIIICSILCIYRIRKRKNSSGGQESRPNGSREGQDIDISQQRQGHRISRQSSQYFERYNSVYGIMT